MERGFKGTKAGITAFVHFGVSGSQPNFSQLDTFYKQLLMKTVMEET